MRMNDQQRIAELERLAAETYAARGRDLERIHTFRQRLRQRDRCRRVRLLVTTYLAALGWLAFFVALVWRWR